MQARGASIPIATDVVCGKNFAEDEPAVLKAASDVSDDDMIFDIGPNSARGVGGDYQQSRNHCLERSGWGI